MGIEDVERPDEKLPILPGDHLAAAAWFLVIGIALSNFPFYESMPATYSWFFALLSYLAYAASFIAALGMLKNMQNERIVRTFLIGLVLGIAGYIVHLNTVGNHRDVHMVFLLRIVVLGLLIIGAGCIFASIPLIFVKRENEHVEQPRYSRMLNFVIAMLSVISAFITIIGFWQQIHRA